MSNRSTGTPLPEELQNKLRDEIRAKGERAVSERLRVSRNALYRGAAGLGIRWGTHVLITSGLQQSDPPRAA